MPVSLKSIHSSLSPGLFEHRLLHFVEAVIPTKDKIRKPHPLDMIILTKSIFSSMAPITELVPSAEAHCPSSRVAQREVTTWIIRQGIFAAYIAADRS